HGDGSRARLRGDPDPAGGPRGRDRRMPSAVYEAHTRGPGEPWTSGRRRCLHHRKIHRREARPMNAEFEIHLFEEHSDTLSVWWQHRRPGSTVVYLDAHLDLQETTAGGIERLRQCNAVKEVRRLAAPHHLNQSQHYAYGIEDFPHPASRLGLLERLIWVAPPHVPRGYTRSLVEYMQQMDGIDFDELTGFRRTGGAFRGRLLGLDITICDYEHLADIDIG